MNLDATSRPSRSFHVAAILVLSSLAISQHAKPSGEPTLSSFVVVPGATHVTNYELEGGRKQLSYRIRAKYPAQKVLDTIKLRLSKRAWVPLAEDYLNSGLKTSIVRGWTYFEDDATNPKTSVRVWQADWRRNRELVTYRLEYRCPNHGCASPAKLFELHIVAIYAAQVDSTYRR